MLYFDFQDSHLVLNKRLCMHWVCFFVTALVSYLSPFQYCPRWLAPNLMTFVGFVLLVANFFVLSFYDFHFTASSAPLNDAQIFDSLVSLTHIPSWVWLFCAFGQFVAHTLDGCDGKQARRTGKVAFDYLGNLSYGLYCILKPLTLNAYSKYSHIY